MKVALLGAVRTMVAVPFASARMFVPCRVTACSAGQGVLAIAVSVCCVKAAGVGAGLACGGETCGAGVACLAGAAATGTCGMAAGVTAGRRANQPPAAIAAITPAPDTVWGPV
jgi:hypothetical protein